METNTPTVPPEVAEDKQWRKDLDVILQQMKNSDRKSRERSITITKIEEAIMWLGKDLQELGRPNPYPTSMDPASPVIHPPADGLKH